MMRIFESPGILHWIIFIFVAGLCGLIFIFFIGWWEFFFLDLKFLLSHSVYGKRSVSDEIALILVDNKTLDRLYIPAIGTTTRQYHTKIVEVLASAGVKAIIFDIEFVTPAKEWDQEFGEKLKASGNVIAAESGEKLIVEEIRKNLFSTGDPGIESFWGVPRKIYQYPNQRPALAFQAALYYLHTQIPLDAAKIKKINSLKSMWINFKTPLSSFPVFSYIDVLEASNGRIHDKIKTPLSFFKDRIVLIDYISAEFPAPDLTKRKLPGVYAHAYGIQNLLSFSYLKSEFLYSIFFMVLSLILIHMLLFLKNRFIKIVCFTFFLIFVFFIEYILLITINLWLACTPVIVSSVVLLILHRVQRRRIFNKEYQELSLRIKQLEEVVVSIKQSENQKGLFTAGLVHDIKNHAAAIDTAMILLYKKYEHIPGIVKILNLVKSSSTDIITLASNIMETAQMEDGALQIKKSNCDHVLLSDLFRKYAGHPAFVIQHIEIEIIPPPDTFFIMADQYLLDRIIQNLFNNASKYTNKKGRVVVRCMDENSEKIISLYNTSPPIPENKREFIFEKYNRMGRTASPYSRGLGLYFCKIAMQAHGGRIWVETDEEGNSFNLEFCE